MVVENQTVIDELKGIHGYPHGWDRVAQDVFGKSSKMWWIFPVAP